MTTDAGSWFREGVVRGTNEYEKSVFYTMVRLSCVVDRDVVMRRREVLVVLHAKAIDFVKETQTRKLST